MMKLHKKAEDASGFTLLQLIGLVCTFIILVALFTFIKNMYYLWSNAPDQGTQESFKALAQAMQSVEQGKWQHVSFYIDDGFKVVGFNQNQNRVQQSCGLLNPDSVKPQRCGASACLVLCSETNNGCRDSFKEYQVFEDLKSITVKDLDQNQGVLTQGSHPFVIYGKCFFSKTGPIDLYITKTSDTIIITGKKPADQADSIGPQPAVPNI